MKKISIIIINYNGKKWLKKCLDSLLCQTYENFEIIFVDNNSSDESVEFVKNNYNGKNIIIKETRTNLGFAGGNNAGFEMASGEFILLLNNDTWVEVDFLEKLTKSFDEIPNLGSVQSKIILMDDHDKLDSCGSFWTDSSFIYHYGYGTYQDLEKYNKIMPVFSNKGSAMMMLKDVVDKTGLFDDDFWCYYEETDFCHRLWISGYECWYYPKTICYHAMGGTSLGFDNGYIQFHNFKNKLSSFLKNCEIKTLIKILPIYFVLNIAVSVLWLIRGRFGHFLAIYRAIFWNIKNINKTIKKRRFIQKSLRKVSDSTIFKKVKRNPKLNYFYYLLNAWQNYEDQ